MPSRICSLCSTRCAALIALATAAGISRLEPLVDGTNAARSPRTEQSYLASPPLPSSVDQSAAWLGWYQAFLQVAVDAGGAPGIPDTQRPVPDFARPGGGGAWTRADVSPAFSVCAHSLPFAVGPPSRVAAHQPRADGTHLPCDSAARRTPQFRIATLPSLAMARVARRPAADASIEARSTSFNPSVASRGVHGFAVTGRQPSLPQTAASRAALA